MAGITKPVQPRGLYGGLFGGVVAVSFAALFIRLAAAPALGIASYRLGLASLPVVALTLARRRHELLHLRRDDLGSGLLSGLCLAGHFATWVASLQFASVASSVAFVTTSPIFVAAIAFAVTGERISRPMLGAIGICIAGGAVIGAVDLHAGGTALTGDGLALAGAIFSAAYFALGRRMRRRVSLLSYVGIVYPVAAVVLVALALLTRQPLTGYSPHTYLFLALLALIPQIIGHSTLNWALGYLSAPFVAIAVLGEPVLATILAWIVLSEWPGPERIAGGVLILIGVYVAMRDEHARLPDGAKELVAGDTL